MRAHKLISICVSLLLLVGFSSCSGDSDDLAFDDVAVVEAYLFAGDTAELSLSRKIPFDEGVELSTDDINALLVRITYNDSDYVLTPMGDGVYKDVNGAMPLVAGATYVLHFEFAGKTVRAETIIPTAPLDMELSAESIEISTFDTSNFGSGTPPEMPDPITVSWTNADASYYLIVVNVTDSDPDPINDVEDENRPDFAFRKEPNQSSETELSSRDFQYYGNHSIELYHLNPDYAALYNSSSNSSQNLTNPITNVENGLGIFTGINKVKKTIQVLEP